jgi:hypothetical protein
MMDEIKIKLYMFIQMPTVWCLQLACDKHVTIDFFNE